MALVDSNVIGELEAFKAPSTIVQIGLIVAAYIGARARQAKKAAGGLCVFPKTAAQTAVRAVAVAVGPTAIVEGASRGLVPGLQPAAGGCVCRQRKGVAPTAGRRLVHEAVFRTRLARVVAPARLGPDHRQNQRQQTEDE